MLKYSALDYLKIRSFSSAIIGLLTSLENIAKIPDWQVGKLGKSSISFFFFGQTSKKHLKLLK